MLYDGSGFILKGFKLLYAQSVQGIRKELWDKREELKDDIRWQDEAIDRSKSIEATFKDIENLFNIGDEV